MPVLKVYKDGVWEEVSGVSGHSHSIDDIVDFPNDLATATDVANLQTEVTDLQTKVGDTSVSEQIADSVTGLQQKHVAIIATLSSSGWSSNSQTVTATGVTSLNTVIVGAHPSYQESYNDNCVVCTEQGENTLTFTCSETPTDDLQVNVIILN